jgi:hypothetical protein
MNDPNMYYSSDFAKHTLAGSCHTFDLNSPDESDKMDLGGTARKGEKVARA